MNKRALVTGGCGFIGSNLIKKLIEIGWIIDVVDDLSNGNLSFLYDNSSSTKTIRVLPEATAKFYKRENDSIHPQVVVYIADFVSESIIKNVVEKKYDIIFHLAANPRVEYTVNNPVETTDTNLFKTIRLMTHCIGNIQKFIFSSTCAVYGDAVNIPTSEKELVNPNSPYALQKFTVEEYGKLYSKLYNLDFISLRYFNVYGPNQFGNSPYSTAISSWCDKVKNGLALRSDGDGTQSRDMVYVSDVVNANILAANSIKVFRGQAVNIGCGMSFPNNQILRIFQQKFKNLTIKNAPWRPGDVKHTLANIWFAKKLLNYEPQVLLEEGLEKIFDWWELNEKS